MMNPKILFISQDHSLSQQINSLLLCQNLEVIKIPGYRHIIDYFKRSDSSLLLLESSCNTDIDVLEIARQIKKLDKHFPIILLTTQSSEALAVASLRSGVDNYFKSPISDTEFINAVNRCISVRQLQSLYRQPRTTDSSLSEGQNFIGESLSMCKMKAYLRKVAAVDSHVLITGETGTGKELAAQFIHLQSSRRTKPFIAINCAALPDGLLESELFGYEKGAFTGAQYAYGGKLKLADGGTVFFDEIGDMSPYAQAKILRVIESKEVYPLGGKRSIPLDIRIIAATNCDLEYMVSKKEFRQDLYFRLNIARVQLPPLRERKEDVPVLANYYLQEFNKRFEHRILGFSDEARELLLAYDWPGNIRELKNLLEAIYIDPPIDLIDISHLPTSICQYYQAEQCSELKERDLLLSTLNSVNWNKSKAAEQLSWSRMTLYRKMAKYYIQKSQIVRPDSGNT